MVYSDPKRRQQHPGIAATINGSTITIEELAEECIARYGRDVLEGAISRRLLEQECRRKKIQVTQRDVDLELTKAATALGQLDPVTKQPDVDGWLKSVTDEQGISRELYIQDAVWPSVALKRIVEKDVKVTQQDLDRGYEANYGPRVRCRAIVLNNLRRAQEVWDMARKDPSVSNFGRLAEQFSIEASSRALRGEVPPIQKWGGSAAPRGGSVQARTWRVVGHHPGRRAVRDPVVRSVYETSHRADERGPRDSAGRHLREETTVGDGRGIRTAPHGCAHRQLPREYGPKAQQCHTARESIDRERRATGHRRRAPTGNAALRASGRSGPADQTTGASVAATGESAGGEALGRYDLARVVLAVIVRPHSPGPRQAWAWHPAGWRSRFWRVF